MVTNGNWRAATAAVVLMAATAGVHGQTVLTASSWVPPGHSMAAAQKQWCDLLEQRSSARLKCNILPRGVASPPGTFDAIKNGLADVSFTVHGYTPGRFTLTRMAEFAFLGDKAETISVAFDKVARKYPAFAAEHRGTKVLAMFTHGPGLVMNSKRPIRTMDDLSGLKFRVGGGVVNDIAQSLGINATLKPGTESYELLATGVMDGTLFPAESAESFKLSKVVKYATVFPGGLYNTSFVFLMNQDRYDKLDARDRQVIDSISGETAARLFGRSWDRGDERGLAHLRADGVPVIAADAAFVASVKQAVAPLEQRWVQEARAQGLADPAAVLAEFRAAMAQQ
ncbi:MAG: TRAP transporter substrate-binding protein [Burkholderiaceae bacterium]